jgi:enoyl-CoA hydratase/carnithine racemase
MVLKREQRGAVSICTVDRPAAKNAVSRELALALRAAALQASEDPATSVLVVASSGEIFLSGGDLKELAALPFAAEGAEQVLTIGAELAALEECAVPVIAAVDGDAYGGGCELLLLCDLVVMARGASLRFVHARMGLAPAWGGMTRLVERVGAARAADIILRARPIAGEEAVAMGLASHAVADGTATAVALTLAAEIARLPRAALVNVKRSLVAVRRARRAGSLAAEAQVFRDAWGGEAHRAAFAALNGATKRER